MEKMRFRACVRDTSSEVRGKSTLCAHVRHLEKNALTDQSSQVSRMISKPHVVVRAYLVGIYQAIYGVVVAETCHLDFAIACEEIH